MVLLVLASLIPSLPELSLHSTVSISLASATRPQRLCIIDLDSSLYHHLYLVLKLGGRHLLPSLLILLAIIGDTRRLGGCNHAPCHRHGRPRPDILHNTESLSDVEEKIFIKMQDFKVEDRARRIYRRCLGSINLFLNLLFVITELMSQVSNIPNNVNINTIVKMMMNFIQVQSGLFLSFISENVLLDEEPMKADVLESLLPVFTNLLLYFPCFINPLIFLTAEYLLK